MASLAGDTADFAGALANELWSVDCWTFLLEVSGLGGSDSSMGSSTMESSAMISSRETGAGGSSSASGFVGLGNRTLVDGVGLGIDLAGVDVGVDLGSFFDVVPRFTFLLMDAMAPGSFNKSSNPNAESCGDGAGDSRRSERPLSFFGVRELLAAMDEMIHQGTYQGGVW